MRGFQYFRQRKALAALPIAVAALGIGASGAFSADPPAPTSPPLSVTNLSRHYGAAGGLGIFGTGFAKSDGSWNVTKVTVGGTSVPFHFGYTATREPAIGIDVPEHPPGKVDVIVSNETTSSPNTPADDFTYGPIPGAPVLTSVNGAAIEGKQGAAVIRGTHFAGTTEVRIGGVRATNFFIKGDLLIAVIPPGMPAGKYSVTVKNAAGESLPSKSTFTVF